MSNTSKFWVGALIVGAVTTGVIVANRSRVEMTSSVPMAAVETPAPVVSKAALPMPSPRKTETHALVLNDYLATIAAPLLQPGTDLTMATDGFTTRESFLATAYASKNLGVPFVLLKDRVVAQRQPLVTAIRELKPDVDAKAEAARATSAAKSEIARPIGS